MDYPIQAAQLLLNCEDNGSACNYGNSRLSLSSEGKEIFILSDLHLTPGNSFEKLGDPDTERFTDQSFLSFINYIHKQIQPDTGILVINGDFIDFLRIISIPGSTGEFVKWQQALNSIGIHKDLSFLKKSISRRELRYGLNTDDYKSVWKLLEVINGHSELFDSLSDWLSWGNKLVIVKGNHDLEFYWPAVRNLLRLSLAERISRRTGEDTEDVLVDKILPNLIFVDESITFDNKYYIEHGHRYDKYCHLIGGPLLKNKKELNIPFGSFFNRYLLNHIELAYPPFKNVREEKNILPLLIEKRFFVGIRALLQHIPVLFLIIPMRYYRYLFGRVLLIVLTMFLPVLYVMDKFWNIVEPVTMRLDSSNQSKTFFSGSFRIPGLSLLENLVFSFISFVVNRSNAYIQLEEHSRLYSFAKRKFSENPQLKIVTFGHTHFSEIFSEDGREFFNTGAWTPVNEENRNVNKNNFTYLHIKSSSAAAASAGSSARQGMFLKWNGGLNLPEKY
ncbi:MAG: hypothetical protein ACM34K_12430 [Bacillota bacterium]